MWKWSKRRYFKLELYLKEGIIACDDVLNEEEFKNFIRPLIMQDAYIKQFQFYLMSVIRFIEMEDFQNAYKFWELFEKDCLFNNQGISLMIIDNIQSDSSIHNFYFESSEFSTLDNKGVRSNLTNIKQQLIFQRAYKAVSNHFNSFLLNLNEPHWFPEDIFQELKANWKSRRRIERKQTGKHTAAYSRYVRLIRHDTPKTLWYVYYGENPAAFGWAADAFTNHLAHFHAELFNNATSNFKQTVLQEEKENIYRLLANSVNNIGWYTGGDIVLRLKNKMMSIQLKTTNNSLFDLKSIGNQLSTAQLKNQLKILLELITDPEELIKKMYSFFKTSGWVEENNKIFNQDTQKLVSDFTSRFDNYKNFYYNI